jgi:S1-C subfamily serine protease
MLGIAGVAYRDGRRLDAERAALLARTDSALARLEGTTSTVAGLRAALDSARDDTRRLRAQVAAGGGSPDQLARLSNDMSLRLSRQQAVVRAAEFDAAAIARANADAIALVVIEFPDGRRVAGTGFALRVRGDTGWIATARHLVVDSLGRLPRRLGVIFNGSNQNFRAELVARADSADLALLSVRIRGGMPVIRALGGVVRPGDPVAILGFPFGLDFPFGGDWRRLGVSVSSFAGSLSGMNRTRLEVNGFGATGSSGSPLFNAAGEVVGVLFGGDPRSAEGTVYATPAAILEALLATLPTRG